MLLKLSHVSLEDTTCCASRSRENCSGQWVGGKRGSNSAMGVKSLQGEVETSIDVALRRLESVQVRLSEVSLAQTY